MEKGNDESSNLLSVARRPLSVDLKKMETKQIKLLI